MWSSPPSRRIYRWYADFDLGADLVADRNLVADFDSTHCKGPDFDSRHCKGPDFDSTDCEGPDLDSPIATVIWNMIRSAPSYAASHVKEQLQHMAAYLDDGCLSSIPVTTSCSGTDLIVEVLKVFFLIFTQFFHLEPIHILHEWSCENEPYKCRWIREVMSGKLIFTDCAQLPKGFGTLSRF